VREKKEEEEDEEEEDEEDGEGAGKARRWEGRIMSGPVGGGRGM